MIGPAHEDAGIVEDLAGASAFDRMHLHGLGEEHADMLEGDGVGRAAVAPQRGVLPIAELAVRVVVDLRDDVGVRPGRRDVILRGALARHTLQGFEIIGFRRPELKLNGSRLLCFRRADPGKGGGLHRERELKEGPAVETHGGNGPRAFHGGRASPGAASDTEEGGGRCRCGAVAAVARVSRGRARLRPPCA